MRLKTTAIGCAGLAAAMIVAACGSDDTSASTSTSASPAAAAAKPTATLEQLTLAAAEFPPGVELQPVTAAQIKEQSASVNAALATADVTPAECAGKSKASDALQQSLLDNSALASGVNMQSLTTFTSMVVGSAIDVRTIADGGSGTCADVKATVNIGGTETTTSTHTDILPVAAGIPADSVLLSVTTNTEQAGTPGVALRLLRGFAVVRGLTVSLQMQTLNGAAPDRGQFDALFAKAVEKVEQSS